MYAPYDPTLSSFLTRTQVCETTPTTVGVLSIIAYSFDISHSRLLQKKYQKLLKIVVFPTKQ